MLRCSHNRSACPAQCVWFVKHTLSTHLSISHQPALQLRAWLLQLTVKSRPVVRSPYLQVLWLIHVATNSVFEHLLCTALLAQNVTAVTGHCIRYKACEGDHKCGHKLWTCYAGDISNSARRCQRCRQVYAHFVPGLNIEKQGGGNHAGICRTIRLIQHTCAVYTYVA